MGTKTKDEYGEPWALPVVYYRIRRYFVDLRLRQFREIENPGNCVEFESEQGQQMCRQSGIMTCPECGMSVIVPAAVEGEELRCMKCSARTPR